MSTETIALSKIVRASIQVSASNPNKCASNCQFYKCIGALTFIERGCSAFHVPLKNVDSAELCYPQARFPECIAMFGFPEKHVTGSSEEPRQQAHKIEKPEEPEEFEHETSPEPEESASADADADDAFDNGDGDEELSDTALGLDSDDLNKPLDDNDPVIKDKSWKHYKEEEPKPYSVVSVYGVLFTPNTRGTERMLVKKVRVFLCTDEVREILHLERGLGYGKVIGTNETIEIHRWRKSKAYVKQVGK